MELAGEPALETRGWNEREVLEVVVELKIGSLEETALLLLWLTGVTVLAEGMTSTEEDAVVVPVLVGIPEEPYLIELPGRFALALGTADCDATNWRMLKREEAINIS